MPTILQGSLPGDDTLQVGNTGVNPYLAGFTPAIPLMRVDETHPAWLHSVKYSHHPVGGTRPEPAPSDPRTRVTILLEGGPWVQTMWNADRSVEVTLRLAEPGDYIAWQPGYFHSWTAEGRATMLTLSIQRP